LIYFDFDFDLNLDFQDPINDITAIINGEILY